jgi:hypothetical protein
MQGFLQCMPFLVTSTFAAWVTENADFYRSSLFNAPIPAADTGVEVESVISLGQRITASPVYSSSVGAAYVADNFCNVAAIRAGSVFATWSNFDELCNHASLSLDETGSFLVLQGQQGDPKFGGFSFVQALQATSLLPGPGLVRINDSISFHAPLLMGGFAWLPSVAAGAIWRIDYVSGAILGVTPPSCTTGGFHSPHYDSSAVAIDAAVGLLAVISTEGCLTVISAANGTVVWTQPVVTSVSELSYFAIPAVFDALSRQLYVATVSGLVCCILIAEDGTGLMCGPWEPSGCSQVPGSSGFVGGLALTPRSDGFHQGQIFLVDVEVRSPHFWWYSCCECELARVPVC